MPEVEIMQIMLQAGIIEPDLMFQASAGMPLRIIVHESETIESETDKSETKESETEIIQESIFVDGKRSENLTRMFYQVYQPERPAVK